MRLKQYLFLFCVGLVHAGEVVEPPFDPHGGDPIIDDPLNPHDPIIPKPRGGDPIITNPRGGTGTKPPPIINPPVIPPRGQPAEVTPLQTYLAANKTVPKIFTEVGIPETSVATLRDQYLSKMQTGFKNGIAVLLPSLSLASQTALLQKGVTDELATWMIALTDGLSFARELSLSPQATAVQAKTFTFSAENKKKYDSAVAGLTLSAESFLKTVFVLHKDYGTLFVDGKVRRPLTKTEYADIANQIKNIQALMDRMLVQEKMLLQVLQTDSYKNLKPQNYDQFAADAKTLTPGALAKKYTNGDMQLLLDKAYRATYVLEQQGKLQEAVDVSNAIVHVELAWPKLVSQGSLPARSFLRLTNEIIPVAATYKKELESLQTADFSEKVGISGKALQLVTKLIGKGIGKVKTLVADKIADGLESKINDTEIMKNLKDIAAQIKQAEAQLKALLDIKQYMPTLPPALQAEYQTAFQRLNALKADTTSFAYETEYKLAKAGRDKQCARLYDEIKKLAKSRSSFTLDNDYWKNAFAKSAHTLKNEHVAISEQNTKFLLTNIVIQAGQEEDEDVQQYKTCMWASDMLGVMYSKLDWLSILIKAQKNKLLIEGYKEALDDVKDDYNFLLSSQATQRCVNVVVSLPLISQKIVAVQAKIDDAEKDLEETVTTSSTKKP